MIEIHTVYCYSFTLDKGRNFFISLAQSAVGFTSAPRMTVFAVFLSGLKLGPTGGVDGVP